MEKLVYDRPDAHRMCRGDVPHQDEIFHRGPRHLLQQVPRDQTMEVAVHQADEGVRLRHGEVDEDAGLQVREALH